MAETKPFLDELQDPASSHSGGPVGAHLPEPSTGAPGKVRRLKRGPRILGFNPSWLGGWIGPGQQGGAETGRAEDSSRVGLQGWSRRKGSVLPLLPRSPSEQQRKHRGLSSVWKCRENQIFIVILGMV